MKNQKAITLVALIITVIVLLILATVSINLVINGGILDKAKYAVEKYSDEEVGEQVKLSYLEYQTERLYNTNADLETFMKTSLGKIYGADKVSITKMGKNIKIDITGRNKTYTLKHDGTIKENEKIELMDPTSVYAKLDDDGTLHLRATLSTGYNTYDSSYSIQSNWNTAGDASPASVTKVIIEEPIAPITTKSMFYKFVNCEKIININNIHTENVTNMALFFSHCEKIETLDVSTFDTSKVTDMSSTFDSCFKLKSLNINNFNTGKVKDMKNMFYGDSQLEKLDVSSFDTSEVENMLQMFKGCSTLKEIDVGGFNTRNVKNMYNMFLSCRSINNLYLNNFNTENVTEMNGMINDCQLIEKLDLSSFNTSNVTNMNSILGNCYNLKYLNLGNLFIIKDETNYNYFFWGINLSNLKIKCSEDTKAKLKTLYSGLTESNFE